MQLIQPIFIINNPNESSIICRTCQMQFISKRKRFPLNTLMSNGFLIDTLQLIDNYRYFGEWNKSFSMFLIKHQHHVEYRKYQNEIVSTARLHNPAISFRIIVLAKLIIKWIIPTANQVRCISSLFYWMEINHFEEDFFQIYHIECSSTVDLFSLILYPPNSIE